MNCKAYNIKQCISCSIDSRLGLTYPPRVCVFQELDNTMPGETGEPILNRRDWIIAWFQHDMNNKEIDPYMIALVNKKYPEHVDTLNKICILL